MNFYIELIARALFSYFSLFIIARLMGKRQISQMNFFDYVVGITIGNIAGNMALNVEKKVTIFLPALLVFGLLQIFTSILTLKNRFFRIIFEGKQTVLIEKGKIIDKNMKKTKLNFDRLESLLRDKGVFKLADVDYAYLETSGKVSVLKKAELLPVTPSDLKINVKDSGVGNLIIEEGEVKDQLLRKLGLTCSWLASELKKQGVVDTKDVMFAQVDNTLNLYVDLYDKPKKD